MIGIPVGSVSLAVTARVTIALSTLDVLLQVAGCIVALGCSIGVELRSGLHGLLLAAL